MALYESMIRMSENATKAPEKMQSKVGRKPLGDVTNSSKPQPKGKPSVKNAASFRALEKMQPQMGRKPLGDLTNSNKPRAKEKTPKKHCSEVQLPNGASQENFCHNHLECIKTQRPSMSMDYFLETVGLQNDVSASVSTQLTVVSQASNLKLETHMKCGGDKIEIDMWDICGGTPAPKTPAVRNMDLKDLDFSGFKLDQDFSGFKLKATP